MTAPLTAHPLAAEASTISATVLDEMLRLAPSATLTDLVLERTISAQEAWQAFLTEKGRIVAEYDKLLLLSLLATAELHRSGATWRSVNGGLVTDEERALMKCATLVYGRKSEIIQAYKLHRLEVRAIEAYSDANKNEEFLSGKLNPYYMNKHQQWEEYGDGWAALRFALQKIPSLGRLGLTLTTYRATRKPQPGDTSEISKLRLLKPGTNVVLGNVVMNMGQYHYMSTAITYNTHWDRAVDVGGLIAFTGNGGWLINPFGAQGWLDGAEVLYSPRTNAIYVGTNDNGYSEGGQTVPVAHLRETDATDRAAAVVDDSKYQVSTPVNPQLEQNKARVLSWLSQLKNQAAVSVEMRTANPNARSLNELTYDQLKAIYTKLSNLEF